MTYRITLILALVMCPVTLFAEQEPPVGTDPADAFMAPAQPSEAQQLEEHCQSLQKQMQEVKNRPLRRSALADRYKLECQDPPYGGQ
jgi:hypothetical protein